MTSRTWSSASATSIIFGQSAFVHVQTSKSRHQKYESRPEDDEDGLVVRETVSMIRDLVISPLWPRYPRLWHTMAGHRHTSHCVTRHTWHRTLRGSGLRVTSGHTQSTHQTCVTADVTLNIMILSHCFFLHIFRLIFLIHSWHAHDVMLCLYFSKGQFEMRKLLKCHKSRITT